MVQGCKLEKIFDLDFDFYSGSCGEVTVNSEENLLLCFSDTPGDRRGCQR